MNEPRSCQTPAAPLRICQVVEATGAGVGRHTLDLSEGLVAAGHDVHVVYSPLRSERLWIDRLRAGAYTTHSLDIHRSIGWRDGLASWSLRAYLKRHGPFDIVHGQSSKGGAIARLAAAGSNSRVVYTPHAFAAMDSSARPAKRLVYRELECVLARLTHTIICVSPEELEFANSIGIPRRILRLVPNGIGPEPQLERDEVRQELGVAKDEIVIGFVGRLSPQKAPDLLLKAFAPLAHNIPNCVLAIVGEGNMSEMLVAMATELRIAGRVRWLGWRDGTRIMGAFDMLALPSRYEGLPYVALEALAAGLPIVATTAAGCRLMIDNDRNGLVVPSGRTDLFSDALRRLVTDSARRTSFGQASLLKSSMFQIDVMVRETLAIYRHLMEVRSNVPSAPLVQEAGRHPA